MTEEKTNGRVPFVLLCYTVLRVFFRKPEVGSSFFSTKGNLVKVKPGSKYYGSSPKTTGKILAVKPKEPGWAYVSFTESDEKEERNRFRTGSEISLDNGACDLEPAEQEDMRYALINSAGQLIEILVSDFEIEPGDTLKLNKETMKVMAVGKATPSGGIAFVTRIVNDTVAEVDYDGGRRTVFSGKFTGKLEINGRVVLDQSGNVIIENFGLDDGMFTVREETGVSWEDVVGQGEAVEALQNSIELPQKYPNHFKFLKSKPAAGFLLFGPPGCSKTMLVKAVHTAMMKLCKEKGIVNSSGGLILISGPEILDKFVGSSEAMIRNAFARGRAFYKRTGIKAVLALDECEAVLAKRDSGISSDVLRTIVPTFLAEMQGVNESGVIVLLLTNKPEILDSATIRDGRIDCRIEVKRPTKEAARVIFLKNMKDVPVSETTSLDKLADLCVSELFSPDLVIFEIKRADVEFPVKFTLAEVVSGSMIPAIVQSAQRLALKRELQKPEPTEGVREEDVLHAVKQKYGESFASDHIEAMRVFTEGFKDQVVGFQKLRQIQA